MSQQAQTKERTPLNGVDTPSLFATIDAVKGQPELANFKWRASNKWVKGTKSTSRIETFDGAGGSHDHVKTYEYDADHPAVLCGEDQGPTPVEFLLVALSACITSGIANISAARGVTLSEVESTIEGDMNLQGILGLSDEVRNGYEKIRLTFNIKGDAPEDKLRQIVAQSQARSAVFDVITNGVPVEVNVNAG